LHKSSGAHHKNTPNAPAKLSKNNHYPASIDAVVP